jgi:CheY-like chemotaxis protein
MASRGDPRRGEESPDDGAGPEERALAGGACVLPPEISGLHVLVVDDDPLCLKIVGKMLRSCGYSVTTADGGKAALRLLNETPDRFALVLSDVQMPDMDGFRLMECMALELDVPVISASPQRRAPARGRQRASAAPARGHRRASAAPASCGMVWRSRGALTRRRAAGPLCFVQ